MPAGHVDSFLAAVVAWAGEEPRLTAVALVGSYARGTARADSDVDLLLLSESPSALLAERAWVGRFGPLAGQAVEAWGKVTSVRVWYEGGLEVEFGVTGREWAADPADTGDAGVVAAGIRILYDASGELGGRVAAIAAAGEGGGNPTARGRVSGVQRPAAFVGGDAGAGEAARSAGSPPVRRVRVVPYDPAWPGAFEVEAARISEALAGLAPRIHHIGSTAVPGLAAKPIVDLLLEVDDLGALEEHRRHLEGLGYEVMGEFGIPGRRFFRRVDGAGERTHHVHAFVPGDPGVVRHLAFRDYLRAHADAAREYGELKVKLARGHPNDIEAYMEGKDAFVKEYETKALAWRSGRAGGGTGAAVAIDHFAIDAYDEAHALWRRSEGIGLSHADERAGIARYLERNPGVSFTARVAGTLVGTILCGHDGRRGYVHHLAVDVGFRRRGIGTALVERCLDALYAEGIRKCHLFVYVENETAIGFWRRRGWTYRTDIAVMSCEEGAVSTRPDRSEERP